MNGFFLTDFNPDPFVPSIDSGHALSHVEGLRSFFSSLFDNERPRPKVARTDRYVASFRAIWRLRRFHNDHRSGFGKA